jgi:hypothetical protein
MNMLGCPEEEKRAYCELLLRSWIPLDVVERLVTPRSRDFQLDYKFECRDDKLVTLA